MSNVVKMFAKWKCLQNLNFINDTSGQKVKINHGSDSILCYFPSLNPDTCMRLCVYFGAKGVLLYFLGGWTQINSLICSKSMLVHPV